MKKPSSARRRRGASRLNGSAHAGFALLREISWHDIVDDSAPCDGIETVVIVADDDGLITDCSANVERAFGYAPSELIGNVADILAANADDTPLILLERFRHTGRAYEHDMTLRIRAGTVIPIRAGVEPLQDDAGQIVGTVLRIAADLGSDDGAARWA